MEIHIHALEFWTRIGVPDQERACEQRIIADVCITCVEEASKSDELGETVDYGEVVDTIKMCSRKEHKTLEKFAAEIADAVLAFPRVENVEVSLTKHIISGTNGITITIRKP